MDGHPARIGPYRILEPLGQGGMGVVYRAEQGATGRPVALKTVRVPRESQLQSIRREIHALARLRHPGIVPILDEGLEGGVPWYAMELLDGVTLRRYAAAAMQRSTETAAPESTSAAWWTQTVQDKQASAVELERLAGSEVQSRGGRGGLDALLTLARRLCAPLAFLHGEGVVHRDLKPDNVFVRPDGMPVLMDFGIVSRFGGELSREELEVGGKLFGTLAYMAPEQGRGEFVDARADLYSLGCILYELCTGRPPFVGASPMQVLRQHLKSEPVAPSRLAEEVPAELEALVLRLLAKEPHRRLGHAGAVAEALARLGAQDGLAAAGPSPKAYLYRPRFVGRERPMAELLDRLEQAEARRGGLVLIGGESGVGKTRLAMALASEAHRRDVRVLMGECDPAGAGSEPLHALRRSLQAVADRCRELGPAETERLLGARAQLLARYEPALRELPGLEGLPRPEDLSSDAAPLRLFHALAETFAALAEARPVLLVLDDLQWADELTLGFLDHLLRAFEGASGRAPLLIVGTYRAEDLGTSGRALLRALVDHPQVARIELERLDEDSVRAIVGDMLALPEPSQSLVQALARHAEGNAFFIAEYLRTAVAEGLLFRDPAGRWQLGEVGARLAAASAGAEKAVPLQFESLPLPRSVRELVGRRLQGLPPEARGLVQVAAVLGREADSEQAQAVSALGDAPFFEALDELLRRQVLEASGPERMRFLHDQLREVALEGMAAERLQGLHRTAARAIEARGGAETAAAGLARHWEQAGEALRAAHYWTEAGHRALAAYAVEEAAATLDHAVELLGPAAEPGSRRDLIRALDARSRLRDHLGRFAEAAADASRAAGLARSAGDRLSLGRALRQEGVTLYNSGDYAAALERYTEALGIMELEGDPEEICETRHLIGWIHSCRGEYEEAMNWFRAALETPGVVADSSAQLNARMQLALTLYYQGHLREALEAFEELLSRQERRHDRLNQARCKSAIGLIHRDLGEPTAALRLLEEAQESFRRLDSMQDFLICSNNIGLILLDRGSYCDAESVFDATRETAERSGEAEMAGIAAVQSSHCHLCLGHLDAATELAAAAVRSFERLGNRRWLVNGLLRHAAAYAATGHLDAADECFERALEMDRKGKASIERWKTCMAWAETLLQQRAPRSKVRELTTEAMNWASKERRSDHALMAKLLLDLQDLKETAEDQDRHLWEVYWQDVGSFVDRERFSYWLRRHFLTAAEIAIEKGNQTAAARLLKEYHQIAHLEHVLHESRADRLESLLSPETHSPRSSDLP
jgi:serine/threonine protein kinase/tetratricopeptide (TPR) repeat protein